MRVHLSCRKQAVILGLLVTMAVSLPQHAVAADAAPDTDCPAAFRPFSTNTSLLDILLSPQATDVVNKDLPGFLSGLPPFLKTPTPPTLADVLTIRIMGTEFAQMPKSALDQLDKDLAAIPVTRETALIRCARYDETPPSLPASIQRPAILVFSKSNGFRDGPSVDAGKAALTAIGESRHWNMVFIDNAAVFQCGRSETL